MPRTVGIDPGTTNSVIGVIEGGEPVVIPTTEGIEGVGDRPGPGRRPRLSETRRRSAGGEGTS